MPKSTIAKNKGLLQLQFFWKRQNILCILLPQNLKFSRYHKCLCQEARYDVKFKVLIEVEQSYEASCEIEVKLLLACGETVRCGIIELCEAVQEDFEICTSNIKIWWCNNMRCFQSSFDW